jgi:hypothetical protein
MSARGTGTAQATHPVEVGHGSMGTIRDPK